MDSLILPLALAGMVILFGMLLLDGGGNNTQKRVATLSARAGEEKKGFFDFLKPNDASGRRRLIEDSLSNLEEDAKSKKKKEKSLQSRLIQANTSMPPAQFILISGGLAFTFGFLPLLLGIDWRMCVGLAIGFGVGLPRWILSFMIGRRQKAFIANFADAMEIIVRGVRTGLPLGDCLKIIAHEAPEPVKSEFQLVVEGEQVGVPIDVCLRRMYERMPLSEVNFFATVLNIQRSTGGNLGESLANLAKVLRGRKLLREKIKALAAEAKMSAIIIGVLPPGVMMIISVVSPDYMTELYTTPTGHKALMFGVCSMAFGIFVMRKMINFKV
ncbi:MAG: type II secretion system F family protein [Maricaulaceae bacterium]